MNGRLVSRRELLRIALGASALAFTRGVALPASLTQRPIPRTGESLPVVGLGTWLTFDVGKGASERAPLREVLREFVRIGGGGSDFSPLYGGTERGVGGFV